MKSIAILSALFLSLTVKSQNIEQVSNSWHFEWGPLDTAASIKEIVKTRTVFLIDIEEATLNGDDISEFYLKEKAYIAFYKIIGDSTLLMANVCQVNQSQSYGAVIPHPLIVTDEPYQGNHALRTYYKWFYENTFDEISGTANIELIRIYKPEGQYYILKMTTDNFDLMTLKGHLDENALAQVSESD